MHHPGRLPQPVLRVAAYDREARDAEQEVLVAEIQEIFDASKARYGAPRIHAEFKAQGHRIACKTVAKLIKENGIRPIRGKGRVPIATDSRKSHRIAPNLLDWDFSAAAPNTVWLADISYIPTDEGWLYPAAVKDMATMEIVGWAMSDRLKAELALDAPTMAIGNRRPPPDLIHHSDRGVQYACDDHRKLLDLHKMKPSMSRKGNCLEFEQVRASGSNGPVDHLKAQNAPMESFFSSLKNELVHRTHFQKRREAKAALFEYIEVFYNRQRRHSSTDDRTPAQARLDMEPKIAA